MSLIAVEIDERNSALQLASIALGEGIPVSAALKDKETSGFPEMRQHAE